MQFLEQNLKPNYCSIITGSKTLYGFFHYVLREKKTECSFWAIPITCCQIYSFFGKIFMEFYWMPGNVLGFYVCVLSRFSHFWLFVTPPTIAHQAPLSMGCSRQKYWSGLPCPSPGGLPNPAIEPASLTSPELTGRFFTTGATWEALSFYEISINRTKFLVIKDYILKEG